MSEMFLGCSNLLVLNLRDFNTLSTSESNMNNMFDGCAALTTVYVGDKWGYPAGTTDSDVLGSSNAMINRNTEDPIEIHDTYLKSGEEFRDAVKGKSTSKQATKIVFTQKVKPASTAAINMAYDGSDKVVGWKEGTVFYVSTQSSEKIYASMNCKEMFSGLDKLEEIDFDNLDTSNMTTMESMFSYCSSLKSLDLSGFDTRNVTNMDRTFKDCYALESIEWGQNINTENVTSMASTFSDCSKLNDLDMTRFNTAKVTDMSSMFWCCESLKSVDLRSFNTAKVTDMSDMFYACRNMNVADISSFEISQEPEMDDMFYACDALTTVYISDSESWNDIELSKLINNNLSADDIFQVKTAE